MRGRSPAPLSTGSLLFSLLVVACLLLVAANLALPSTAHADASLSKMRLAASNEWLELYIDDATAAVAVKELKTGHVWHTNPPNWDKEETVAKGDAKQALGAQIQLTYYQPGDVEIKVDSYKDSVLFEQHEVEEIPGGIRVTYLFGREYGQRAMVPNFISRSRVEEIRNNLGDPALVSAFNSKVLKNYTLVKMEPLLPGESPLGIASVDVAELFSGHKLVPVETTVNDTRMRELVRSVVLTVLNGRSELEGFDDLKREHFLPLVDKEFYVFTPWTPQFLLDSIEESLKDLGYLIEQRTIDCEEFGIEPPLRNMETFVVPVEYILEGDTLLVRIPVNEVQYPRDVVDVRGSYGPMGGLVTFPLCSIRVLPYFGAVGKAGSGYIFVPDGSGALINLNNGRVSDNSYAARVYGRDHGVSLQNESTSESASIRMPVYGLKDGDKAFLTVIEDGAALATVYADIAGRVSSYNTVGPAFQVMERAWTALSGDPTMTRGGLYRTVDQVAVYQKEMYKGDIRLRYCFLSGDEADYVGMARRYQEYLVNKDVLKRRISGGDIPFFVELIGGIEVRRSILGLPVNVVEPLTTFAQVGDIVDAILDAGVSNLRLRYTGWLAGGAQHVFPDRVRLEDALGNRQQFETLVDRLKTRGVGFYPDVAFLYVYRNSLFDRVIAARDASRTVDRRVAEIYDFNLATFQIEKNKAYVLSPRRLGSTVDRFLSSYAGYGLEGISVKDMGAFVNSDNSEKVREYVGREEASEIVATQAAKMVDAGLSVITDKGNAYMLPYVDAITGIPSMSSEWDIIDRSVPFMQIVLHGFVDYAGDPINLSARTTESILRLVELGACPLFTWCYADSEVVKNSDYDQLYALHYGDWLDGATTLYAAMNSVLREVRDQTIIDHAELAEGVTQTTYANGYSVVVNYGKQEYAADGVLVPALSFCLLEGVDSDEEQ
jgi:hypothetical protein